uniref:A4_EXTRA domain-containing protein n=1 Tax=Panagrellus redivivus TaxID=6233 RepID=A0A7E4UQT4_PANRE
MAAAALLAFFVAGLALASSTLIEGVSANVDGVDSRFHQTFLPLVAFKCGYRNQYMRENGEWHSDDSHLAQCLEGKYDILKYCKRVYPGKNISNIVEYSHEVNVHEWCKEDGTQCKHSFTVRPFQCIVGEFVTESLQVPGQCHFSHVIGRSSCDTYKYWNGRATKECADKVEAGKQLALHSFAILEPCGLDMFRGVEFVCCPASEEAAKNAKSEQELSPAKTLSQDDDEDEDDDDDDDEDEDSEESLVDNKEADDTAKLDPYFKEDDSENEHERFKDAEERLEKKHRKKVTKVITEWSELFERYNKMKENDPKGAEEYKREMTARFRKTVAALEEENKEQRQQIEQVHDQRVAALLNEKKRQATHEYRTALAMQVGAQNKNNVLKSLKNYIRAEEKDRTHMLNRYRHLLRTDTEQAQAFEPVILHRLRYIDLRINGTIAMLRDFPKLDKQLKEIAVEFWEEYRRENTPEITDTELLTLGDDKANEKLIETYKKTYERQASLSDRILIMPTATSTAAPSTTVKTISLKSILSGKPQPLSQDTSDEDSDDDDEDSESSEEVITPKKISIGVEKEEKTESKPEVMATEKKAEDDSEDDEDYEDEDDDDESSEESEEKDGDLRVVIEPIVGRPLRIEEELPEQSSYAKQERLVNIMRENDFDTMTVAGSASNTLVIIALVFAVTATTFLIVLIRRRTRHPGFIEVDVCTPEERHVAGMQVTGYENPTYSFFDAKA